ncbi:DUF1508 domain-containing protein [Pseudomonas sp. SCA2728.1_7]|jgi:uncharacterized protein YegP (UPF0339 family)|uniref:YegP family protein n=1 Tax=Pseudomonas sp. SCA2728.1_7 TaxID=2825975 RepID=UPI001BAFFBB3|nr:DUF1508 domain-containing protein [Pseudomonas sp. SCA2728.1_7]QUE92958.1 DUF1508 domain-containing protein [Pseudomonas sp. SCA2728.1_7]
MKINLSHSSHSSSRQSRGTPSPGKGQWRWRLRAGNHETIASGESYVNKADCLHVIGLIKAGETPAKEI